MRKYLLHVSFQRLREWEPYIYVALIILLTVSQSALIIVYLNQNHRIKTTAITAAQAAKTAALLASATQKNRIEVIRGDCENQNDRHRKAVGALYKLLAKSGVKPERRQAAALPIIQLISALAPQQDCDAVVRAATPKPVKH